MANGRNFAQRASQAFEERRRAQQAAQDRAELSRFAAEFAGKIFESRDARELVAVAADGSHALHRRAGVDGTLPLGPAREVWYLLNRIADGELREREAAFAAPPAVVAASRTVTQSVKAPQAGYAELRTVFDPTKA